MKVKELTEYLSPITKINIMCIKDEGFTWEAEYLSKKEIKEKFGERKISGIYPYNATTMTIEVEKE